VRLDSLSHELWNRRTPKRAAAQSLDGQAKLQVCTCRLLLISMSLGSVTAAEKEKKLAKPYFSSGFSISEISRSLLLANF
jgi:hypothetical protein